ncbi:mitochondrial inner membrane protease ATP23 homolog [Hylaeus anthracinus]|uniref:mitochondrial inner membrane protease ATP23 homolog n=1 Tax=Hylaeus anthracinus TaxID=313031 RepID=UPI0023B98671|nr:mitochondrial inner membrane protease ATP23 homolog [Hylaeus anthracinus]
MTLIKEGSKEETVENKSDEQIKQSDLYPERRGQKPRSWLNRVFYVKEREELTKLKCEANVYNCIKESALVKLMMAALKSAGCEIDIRRHISCEVCDLSVTGGYDPELNQIVICQNNVSKSVVQGVLSHEMIHMFDFCRNNLDLNNIDHLACTEIRAANLCHCSFMSAWIQGLASPFNIKEAHQNCVKDKAIKSILAVRNVSEDKAREAVQRVFHRCYNDLEPVGRRLRRNSLDMDKAYLEGPLYGYSN